MVLRLGAQPSLGTRDSHARATTQRAHATWFPGRLDGLGRDKDSWPFVTKEILCRDKGWSKEGHLCRDWAWHVAIVSHAR